MYIDEALDMFLLYQELKGNSERTIKIYKEYINYFIDFIGKVDIDTITKKDIERYQISLLNRNAINNRYCSNQNERKLSKYTIKGYVVHLRAFFNYLFNDNIMQVKIFDKYKLVKCPKQIKPILSEHEIEQILLSFENNMLGFRNKCIFLLLLDSGLRVQEVSNLKIKDIYFEQNRLFIKNSKGEKDRIVPITLYTKKELIKYLRLYRPSPEDISIDYLFLSIQKEYLSENAIQNMLYRIKNNFELKKLNPHFLRHTFATRYIINGGDMSTLQLIMGHEDIETTRKYVHLAKYYMNINFDKFSTVNKIIRGKVNDRLGNFY